MNVTSADLHVHVHAYLPLEVHGYVLGMGSDGMWSSMIYTHTHTHTYTRGGTAILKVVRLVLSQYSTLEGLEYKTTLRRDLYAQAYT